MNMKINKLAAAAQPATVSPYEEAESYIHSAIDALSDAAMAGDSKAKESISNLAVVLLDLKSKNN